MHAVDISIRSHDNFVVSQCVESVLNVESGLQQVELLVFVYHLFGQSEGVERFASEREDGLRVDIAAFGDASACRVALSDEDAAFLLAVVFGVAVVYPAVAQFAVVQVCFLGPFASQFGHSGHSFSFLFVFGYFLEHCLGHVGVFVQVVVHFLFYEVAHVFVDRHPVGAHG